MPKVPSSRTRKGTSHKFDPMGVKPPTGQEGDDLKEILPLPIRAPECTTSDPLPVDVATTATKTVAVAVPTEEPKEVLSDADKLAAWEKSCEKCLLSVYESSEVPFEMDLPKNDLRLVRGMRTFTPIVCWFCHKGEKENTKLFEIAPCARWEQYPWTIWTFCNDCEEHARRSAAVHMALNKVTPVSTNQSTINVLRASGEVQPGWDIKMMHHCSAHHGGPTSLALRVENKDLDVSKSSFMADVFKHNPKLVVTPNFPKFYPESIKKEIEEELQKCVAAAATTVVAPNKEETTV